MLVLYTELSQGACDGEHRLLNFQYERDQALLRGAGQMGREVQEASDLLLFVMFHSPGSFALVARVVGGHCAPRLICHLWHALHPLHLWQKHKPGSAFLPIHTADVSVPEF